MLWCECGLTRGCVVSVLVMMMLLVLVLVALWALVESVGVVLSVLQCR